MLRNAIRSALMREGCENITDFDRMAGLREAIANGQPDLILLDSEMDKGGADALITQIRQNKLGKNPFVPAIITVWDPTREVVQRVASSGADDLLLKPVSPAQVLSRISAVINNRKSFVVTGDYIGPDRRKDTGRPSHIRSIAVPNTLRAKVKGEPISASALDALIEEANREIDAHRLKRNAFQIGFQINLLLQEDGESTSEEMHADSLKRLVSAADDTIERLDGTEFEHVASLCQTVSRVVSSIKEKAPAIERKEIELLKPLSEAIIAALNPDSSSAKLAAQITDAVSSFKKRQMRR